MVAYASTGGKFPGSTAARIPWPTSARRGEFVANVVTYALRDAMNASSGRYPADKRRVRARRAAPAPCAVVAPPRVAEAPAALECRSGGSSICPARPTAW